MLEQKNDMFLKYSHSKKAIDTGSPESQVALFTYRIKHITEHLKLHKKDNSTRLSLIKLVGKRKKMLSYIKKKNLERYQNILKSLSLRK